MNVERRGNEAEQVVTRKGGADSVDGYIEELASPEVVRDELIEELRRIKHGYLSALVAIKACTDPPDRFDERFATAVVGYVQELPNEKELKAVQDSYDKMRAWHTEDPRNR
ncbi:hypothetical protein [Actinopolymorpha pittospori]